MGRGDLELTEAKKLLQRMALAAHLLVSAPMRAEANAWMASFSRSRGVHSRGKEKRLDFFSKVPREGAI